MSERPVMRLFRFRPVRPSFDRVLREVILPDLRALPGVRDVHSGRSGPDDLGDRLVASIWETRAAMLDALGPELVTSSFHPELLDDTTDHALEVLPLEVAMTFPDAREPAVLRLAQGCALPGQLDAYVDAVRAGTRGDRTRGAGPIALYLGVEPPDGFRTLSVWSDWSDIEQATGANVRRPIDTQHADRLASFEAAHYEVVRGLAPA